MILTDREIQIAIDAGLIEISPAPLEKAYSSTTVDLTLASNINIMRQPKSGLETNIDPTIPGFNPEATLKELTDPVEIGDEGWLFAPGRLVLAWTREYVKLKAHGKVAARVEGKSSLARLGIGVHITAPTIHAGFEGQVRLEMVNHGPLPVRLKTGMAICQLIFEMTTGTPVKSYKGRFHGQVS